MSEAVSMLTTEMELIIPAPRADRGRGAEAEGYSSAVLLIETRGRWHSSLQLRWEQGRQGAKASLVLSSPFILRGR